MVAAIKSEGPPNGASNENLLSAYLSTNTRATRWQCGCCVSYCIIYMPLSMEWVSSVVTGESKEILQGTLRGNCPLPWNSAIPTLFRPDGILDLGSALPYVLVLRYNLYGRTCSYNITISENVTLYTTTLEAQYFIYRLATYQNHSQ